MTDTFRIEQFAHNPVRKVLLASTKELGIESEPPTHIRLRGVEVTWDFFSLGAEEVMNRNHDDTTMGWEYHSRETDLMVVIIRE